MGNKGSKQAQSQRAAADLQLTGAGGACTVVISFQSCDTGEKVAGGRKSKADGFASRLKVQLEDAGLSVYCGGGVDPSNPQDSAMVYDPAGHARAIKQCHVFVALCSTSYGVGPEGSFTRKEIALACSASKAIIPFWYSGSWPPCDEGLQVSLSVCPQLSACSPSL